MSNTEKAKWTLEDGVKLIQGAEPEVERLGFYLGLYGSVLHVGWSSKDLDILVIPHDFGHDIEAVVNYLAQAFTRSGLKRAVRGRDDNSKLVLVGYTDEGKEIDFFFPTMKFCEAPDWLEDWGDSVTASGTQGL